MVTTSPSHFSARPRGFQSSVGVAKPLGDRAMG